MRPLVRDLLKELAYLEHNILGDSKTMEKIFNNNHLALDSIPIVEEFFGGIL